MIDHPRDLALTLYEEWAEYDPEDDEDYGHRGRERWEEISRREWYSEQSERRYQ